METSNLSEKLTPAARQTLNEVVNDFANELLTNAAVNAARGTGEIREISVHDIVSATKIGKSGVLPRNTKLDRIAALYGMMGVVMALAGFGFFAFQDILRSTASERQLPLIVGLFGVLVSTTGLFLFLFKMWQSPTSGFGASVQSPPNGNELGLVSTWARIELSLRNLASIRLGESSAESPVPFLMERLAKEGALSSENFSKLQKLLALRNMVVHADTKLSPSIISNWFRDAGQILEKLESTTGARSL